MGLTGIDGMACGGTGKSSGVYNTRKSQYINYFLYGENNFAMAA